MLDIKIVEFKEVKASEKRRKETYCLENLLTEQKAYTISEYEETYKKELREDRVLQKKIDFLKAISINDLLIGKIFVFRHRFKINSDIKYTKYSFDDPEEPYCEYFELEKKITKEEEEFINDIYKKFYINPFLKRIFIDLLYTNKVNLEDINMDEIKISTCDSFNIPDGVAIEILSSSCAKTAVLDYINDNWDSKIKPLLMKKNLRLPDVKDIKKINDNELLLYKLREKNQGLSYNKLYKAEKELRIRYKSYKSMENVYDQLKEKVAKLFEKKQFHKTVNKRNNKNT